MLRRSKVAKTNDDKFGANGDQQGSSSYQSYWFIALVLIVIFILLMGERKYVMLFHVQQFFGIPTWVVKTTPNEEKNVVASTLTNAVASTVVTNAGKVKDTGSCEWRPDELSGRCFGLQKQDGDFPTRDVCEKHCCKVGWDCITYQWRKDKGCFIGDIVRLGSERAPTGNWCEPSEPAEWMGKRLIERKDSTSCTFEEETLTGQCYGLGVKKPPKTAGGCEALCCLTEKCEVWQFREDKGCFIGKSHNCDKDVTAWTGRRKPTPEWRLKGVDRPKDA